MIKKIQESANTIAKKRKVKLSEFKIVNQDPPALSDKLVIKKMAEAATELNLSHKKMISRAYHDSLFMARYYKNHKFHVWNTTLNVKMEQYQSKTIQIETLKIPCPFSNRQIRIG